MVPHPAMLPATAMCWSLQLNDLTLSPHAAPGRKPFRVGIVRAAEL